MRDGFKEIPLLQQREIEAKVLGPIIRAFCCEFGKERTYEVVRRTLKNASFESGAETAAKAGQGLESLKENCIKKWNEGGALEIEFIEDSSECCAFNVKKCAFAELYRELGLDDIGTILSCERDSSFLAGFDDGLELVRSETIMEGGSRCDFCYQKKEKHKA